MADRNSSKIQDNKAPYSKKGKAYGADEDKRKMPDFITKAPWYVSQGTQNLDHQKFKHGDINDSFDAWYDKGKFEPTLVTKYRKGACTNCGSTTHTAKYCCERPRKIGAKYTGKDFGKDEVIQNIGLGFEAKRDRWNGYDPSEYKGRIEEWYELEEERKRLKAEELAKKLAEKGQAEKDEDIIDDTRAKDDDIQTFANKDPRIKTTIRNLRIREDTASYLYNLKEEKGDTKERDIHTNPYMDPKQIYLKNDNFVKSGEYDKFLEQEKFAEEAKEKVNSEINPVAMPSQAEIVFKNYKQKRELIKSKKREELLAKYGGAEHLEAPEGFLPEEIEEYQEYGPDGKPIRKGTKKVKTTKYQEDVYINNHTSVWGSYYDDDLGWGYACCLSHEKFSQCRGEEGKREQLKENLERKMKKAQAKQEESPKKLQVTATKGGEEVVGKLLNAGGD